ncbi:MAG: hypothetical protein SF052_19145 [Bacteroidia bacterium]|nr:hypothetical protein [Bacteroidia bacterium]
MKSISCLLFFTVLLFAVPAYAQTDNGNGKSFATSADEENLGDFLAAELEETALWRLMEIHRPDLRRAKDEILLENHNLADLQNELKDRIGQYQNRADQLENSNEELEEANNNLWEIRQQLVFRIIDLTEEKELLAFFDEDDDYDMEGAEANTLREQIVLLEMQLTAYDREMSGNQESIHIQEQLLSEVEDDLFEVEDELEICSWLTETNRGLIRE